MGSSCAVGAGEAIGSVGDRTGSSGFTCLDASDDAEGGGTLPWLAPQRRVSTLEMPRQLPPCRSREARRRLMCSSTILGS
jgi:hypothetical protein